MDGFTQKPQIPSRKVRCEYMDENYKSDWTMWSRLVTYLGPIINIIGGLSWSFKENVDFDNVLDVHVSSKNWEEKGYSHDLDLLITL
jgi:hypothetical protein